MKKFISVAMVMVMMLSVALATSADLVNEINIVGTNTAPKIDGDISAEEWGEPVYTTNGTERKELQDAGTELYLVYVGVEGQETLAAQTTVKSYMRWDNKNLYLAYEVAYPYHSSDQTDALIWQDTTVQSGIVTAWPAVEGDTDTTNYYEIGYSLDSDLKTVKTWKWFPVQESLAGADVAIVRKGTVTNYEIALPWDSALAMDTAAIKEGLQIGITSAYNFKDEAGQTLQYQVGGTMFGKIPSNSIEATLVAAPAEETPTEETPDEETPAEETPDDGTKENPDTADVEIIMYFMAAISILSSAMVIGKKK